jgi:hypothetical protein
MKKYRSYIFIVIALALPLLYHIFNFDDRGGLPAYQWGMLFVSLISYLILLVVALGVVYSLIKGLKNPGENQRAIADASAKLIIVVLVVVLPKVFDDKRRFGWDKEDLKKTIMVSIGGADFKVPVKYLDGTWKKGENVKHLDLVALFPNFEGRSIERKEDFISNHNGIGERIRVYLDVIESINPDFLGKFGDLSNKALYFQYRKNQYGITDETNPISSENNLNYMGSLRQKELYISVNESDLTYYQCDKDPKDGKILFPACETEFPLWGNVVMKYRFSKKYLKDWQTIHKGVWTFVGDMETGSNKKLHPASCVGR